MAQVIASMMAAILASSHASHARVARRAFSARRRTSMAAAR